MEFTLLSLAAVLLLAQGPPASVALVRIWLAADGAKSASSGPVDGSARGPIDASSVYGTTRRSRQNRLARQVRIATRKLNRTRLRGRFVVQSAVFLSTAPPLA